MPPNRRHSRPLLSSTRPRHYKTRTPSSHTTRTLIRTHHTLQKRLSTALATHNPVLAQTLQSQLTSLGGLTDYQAASLAGQSRDRGGDSSRVLVSWLQESLLLDNKGAQRATLPKADEPKVTNPKKNTGQKKWKVLEIGALTTENAISRHARLQVERIDLRSRHAEIKTQDFMQRPGPWKDEEGRVDIVSLSLVLNFVGDAGGRGEMLRRVSKFLRRRTYDDDDDDDDREGGESKAQSILFLPGLFLVLPAPCVTNSRYLDEDRLEAIMRTLGYIKAKRKMARKLVYYFWTWQGVSLRMDGNPTENGKPETKFKKEEIRKGPGRNNFAVVLA